MNDKIKNFLKEMLEGEKFIELNEVISHVKEKFSLKTKEARDLLDDILKEDTWLGRERHLIYLKLPTGYDYEEPSRDLKIEKLFLSRNGNRLGFETNETLAAKLGFLPVSKKTIIKTKVPFKPEDEERYGITLKRITSDLNSENYFFFKIYDLINFLEERGKLPDKENKNKVLRYFDANDVKKKDFLQFWKKAKGKEEFKNIKKLLK